MPRLVVFCDGNSSVAEQLLRSLASAIRHYPAFSIAGIVASKHNASPAGNTVEYFAASAGIPFITHKKGVLKDPVFVEKLFTELKPDVLFSIYCLEIFSPQFLDRFLYTVNYHNGLLPQYRGLNASAWALAMGESQCGYTFHRMTPELDAGNILIQGEIKIKSNDCTHDLEQKMVKHAGKKMTRLLSMIENISPGSKQCGKGGYFSKADRNNITRLASPESLPAKQLVSLCRAFGDINIKLVGRWFRIKRIERAKPSRSHADCLYFSAADGDLIEACEFIGLERIRFRMRRVINRLTVKR